MIPTGGSISSVTVTEIEQPSLTWKLDLEKKRITGRLDGLEAVKQTAFKILQTSRYQHLIYSTNYGSDLETLIGIQPPFLKSEVTRMLEEALTQDDRINGIDNVQTTVNSDSVLVEFTVVSNEGSFAMQREVSV